MLTSTVTAWLIVHFLHGDPALVSIGGFLSLQMGFMVKDKTAHARLVTTALLAWAIIYQQIHDYVLSPRISSRTMTLSPGIALGSALVGGALAGPLGALFAMPTAGMITAFLTKYLPSRPIVVSPESLALPDKRPGKQSPSSSHAPDVKES